MNPILIIAGLFALYEILKNQNVGVSSVPGTSQSTLAPVVQGGQTVARPVATLAPGGGGPNQQTVGLESAGISAGTMIGSTIASSVGSGLASAIPIVGAIAGAIFSSLMAASAKRAAEARNENSAVANEVPYWDNGVQQIVAAYNNGSISLQELYHGMMVPQSNDSTVPSGQGVLWVAYWNVVGPQVQPGRNGCSTGTAVQPSTQSWCSGSYGAGCCVGYDNLKNGAVYVMQAAKQAEANPGRSFTSTMIPTVYASKYGGINRTGYTVTLRKPTTML